MRPSVYGWTMLAAIAAGLLVWRRAFKRDERLFPIFLGGLVGAMVGAKLQYLLSEVWFDYGHPDFWMRVLVGRSILGGLLGGYAAVELVKQWVGYRQPTGDQFAAILPLSIAIGRVGCLNYGCSLGVQCEPAWYTVADRQGVARWPAVQLEIVFNLAAFEVFFFLRRRGLARGAHFFIYLTAYGLFRGAHEFARDTPRLAGPFSGYFFASALLVILGARGWRLRVREGARGREAGRRMGQRHLSPAAGCRSER
jgi:phosphatidylglycerol:prolipoprotein diacylglycerol transferase